VPGGLAIGTAPTQRIAIVTPHLGRDGGLAAHVLDSATALRRAGFDVSLFGGRTDSSFSWPGACTIDEVFATAHATTDSLDQARRQVAEFRPHVVHVHDLADPAVGVHLRRVAPVVFSTHGYPACSSGVHYFRPGQECDRSHGPGCIPNMLFRRCLHSKDVRQVPRLYRATTVRLSGLHRADATIAYSLRVVRHLRANGAHDAHFVPLFVPAPDRSPAPATGRRVLFAGRVVPAKGLDVLLRALSLIDADLEVCGDGWYMPKAQALASRLGVRERVVFSGWRSSTELDRAYAEAALTVMPSVWPEPFGLAGLEALVRKRPVVASATGGIPEWLHHGRSGLLVPPGDHQALASALSSLLDDPERRQAMGAYGRSLIQAQFSEARHVEALARVYSMVAAKS
jgi:glycosyltransferase involved in cell wall biosynthesis